MPATVADPNRSLDSEQISPATIAHHTVYEKTPNLHQSHICQWGAQPYLVGPLSRLVGKPPISPWVSADFLPLTQVVNNTNSAIPLTEIFDRVFSDVCNSLGFEVQKQKKRGSGNNRVYRNLNVNCNFSNITFFNYNIPSVLARFRIHTVCMYVCMVITYSRVWINRVRLPILLWSAEQGK